MTTQELISQIEKRVEELKKTIQLSTEYHKSFFFTAKEIAGLHLELRDKTTILILLRALDEIEKTTGSMPTMRLARKALTQAAETIESV